MNVIGLHGKKRRGKDTVAKIAADLLGGDYKVISPADKLKELLCEALGLSYEDTQEALKIMEDCKDSWTITVTRTTKWDQKTEGSKGRLHPEWTCVAPVTTISGRQLQQFTGDGARRVFGTDFWMDQVLPKPGHYMSEDMEMAERLHWLDARGTLFVPSVRYENEAQRIHDYKGVVIEVVRPGMPDGDGFISEQRLPGHHIDATIVNDGDLMDLQRKTLAALVELEVMPA